MTRTLIQSVLLVFLLLLAVADFAKANDSEIESVIPHESTGRFLNRVPSYAGGQPSPNIVAPTRELGEYQNGPASKMERHSQTYGGQRSAPASSTLSRNSLAPHTLDKRPIGPTRVAPAPVTPAPVTQTPVSSSWR